MAYDEALAARVRDLLGPAGAVTEKKMFGGLAFLTDGNMTVGVRGDDLIVRLDPAAGEKALAKAGVRPFDIAPRPMPGWIMVAGGTLDDKGLKAWVTQARAYVATLPPK
jgi:hypothetical protein